MKLILRPKPTSVYSEVEVATPEGALLYSSDTEPLSAPRKSYFKDANDEILATITTVRMDDKNRAHHVVTSDGRVFDLVRKFRNPASTTESYIKVGSTGWQAITRRAWTSRFEIRSSSGDVLLQARQVAGSAATRTSSMSKTRLMLTAWCCLRSSRAMSCTRTCPFPRGSSISFLFADNEARVSS